MRVESIVYGAEDVGAAAKFFRDWGLEEREGGRSGAEFALPSGQTIRVRAAGDPGLPPAIEAGATAREVIWGVESNAELGALAGELARGREVKTDAAGVHHLTDPNGFAIGLALAAPAPAAAAPEAVPRLNHPLDPPRRARPRRIGHVVYRIRAADRDASAKFYLDEMKFRLSDRALDLGDFMRCPGSLDHHNLFLTTRDDRAGFHHAAFEVADFDEVMLGGAFMKGEGWKATSAPGRHILGSNLFWYFANPAGGNVEYFADMDLMDDAWTPRIWEKHPGFAMWMMA